MLQTLRIRKPIKKLALNKRGFSSIVGAIFAILIIFSLVSTTYVWTLAQNTNYNNAVSQSTQADIDRLNEKGLANVTAYYSTPTSVFINGTLENAGPLPVNITTVWVQDTNTSVFNSTNLSPPLILKPGNLATLSGSTALKVNLTNQNSDRYLCWFVSARGNLISQYSLVLATFQNQNFTTVYQTVNNYTSSNVTAGEGSTIYNVGGESTNYANVSQGIGLIAFDFKGFSLQDLTFRPSNNHVLLNGLTKTYTLSQSHYIVLHVTLTNYDPTQKTMYINPGSAVYYVGSHSGTTKYNSWGLVNVTGTNSTGWYLNDGSQGPYAASYALPYMQPVDVFFAGVGNSGGSVDQNVYPLNVMVYGELGTDPYGQNVPFVAAYIT